MRASRQTKKQTGFSLLLFLNHCSSFFFVHHSSNSLYHGLTSLLFPRDGDWDHGGRSSGSSSLLPIPIQMSPRAAMSTTDVSAL
jgi:hypothetical protein